MFKNLGGVVRDEFRFTADVTDVPDFEDIEVSGESRRPNTTRRLRPTYVRVTFINGEFADMVVTCTMILKDGKPGKTELGLRWRYSNPMKKIVPDFSHNRPLPDWAQPLTTPAGALAALEEHGVTPKEAIW